MSAKTNALMTQLQQPLAQRVLWQELEDAADIPEEANLSFLCQMLDQAIALVPEDLRLRVAGEAFLQLANIHAARSSMLLDAWERSHNSTGPVLTAEGLAELLVRQSLQVDLGDLIQVPEHKYVRSAERVQLLAGDSIAGTVDKNALLDVLEQQADEASSAQAIDVAHDEDISAWVDAIAHYLDSKQAESVSLVELAKQVKYSVIQGEKKGSALVKTWLALLLGGFTLSQCSDFYDSKGIQVQRLRSAAAIL